MVDRFLEPRSPPLCVSLKLIIPVERIFFIAVRHQTQVGRTVVRVKQKSDCQIALAGKDSHFVHVFVADPHALRMDETDFSASLRKSAHSIQKAPAII